jgi:hypothetical protein
MKTIVSIFIIAVFCKQCSAQKHSTVWKVENVKTNYVQKGILDTDYYKPPKYLIGKRLQIQDSLLTLTEVRKNYVGSALGDEFSDTIILEKRIFFKTQKDDEYSLQYPGDEFAECIKNNNDTCFASETFLNLLGVKGNGVNAYLSSSGKHSKTKCILFILKENKEAVLFSENDFLLLFLTKKQ